MDLLDPSGSEHLPVVFCHILRDFEGPEHPPRCPAGANAWPVVWRWAPRVPRGPEHEKKPTAGREGKTEVEKISQLRIPVYGNIDVYTL